MTELQEEIVDECTLHMEITSATRSNGEYERRTYVVFAGWAIAHCKNCIPLLRTSETITEFASFTPADLMRPVLKDEGTCRKPTGEEIRTQFWQTRIIAES